MYFLVVFVDAFLCMSKDVIEIDTSYSFSLARVKTKINFSFGKFQKSPTKNLSFG